MKQWAWQPISVGVTTALVGFTSSFAVVLAGLRAVGASPEQATSGLVALCLLMGFGTIWLTLRHRTPLMLVWSTPGAAILVSAGATEGGWAAAVGAFIITGLLFVLTALIPWLGKIIASIPAQLAQAMLAGVLLNLCLQPVIAFASIPYTVGPVVLLWIVMSRFVPRWATPAAFVLAIGLAFVDMASRGESLIASLPTISITTPTFTVAAFMGISIPLYVVTMASQNVPGVAIMASHGYKVPWKESLLITGAGTMLGAPAGGYTINLAAITAALSASAEAHPDPEKRWIAANTAGWGYLVLAALSPVLVSLAASAPPGLIEAVAGLALFGTLISALAAAVSAKSQLVAITVTFLVAASPIVLMGIGPSFWSLVAGLAIWLLFSWKPRKHPVV